jgi:hypothetical protein
VVLDEVLYVPRNKSYSDPYIRGVPLHDFFSLQSRYLPVAGQRDAIHLIMVWQTVIG